MTRQPEQAIAAAHDTAPGDRALADLEAAVQAVTLALVGGDAHAVEAASARLLTAARAARAVAHARADASGARERLRLAAAQLTAQRESVARAAGAVERAIAVLLPATGDAYGATGTGPRATSTGSLVA